MEDLRDRTVLVTGASAGIGAATARRFSRAGARVVLAARRRDRLEAVAAELEGEAVVLPLDVTSAAETKTALAAWDFDVVVPNAGMARGVAKLHEGDPADWAAMLDTNVKGVLHVLHATLPGMIERGRGDVVLLGSVAGREVYPGGNVYCASKFAVHAIYRALREDSMGHGVRYTTVDPGMVETEFSLVRFEGDRARASAVYDGMTPLQPDDVADAIVWAVTRPRHVNVGEIVLWPTDQTSTTRVHRAATQ